MEIKHLKHHEINTLKWDKQIRDSFNGVIFGFSWYLDIISEDWEALVSEDYNYIMPLTTKHLMGVTYISMPKFAVYMGIFTKRVITQEIVQQFLSNIPYPVLNYAFNIYNKIPESKDFTVKTDTCYKLDLIKSYQRNKEQYKNEFKGAIAKAITSNTAVQNGISPNDFISFMHNEAVLKEKLHQDGIETLRRLAVNAVRYRVGTIYGAYDNTNSLSAAALLIGSHNKTFIVAAGVSKQGMKDNAMFYLMDVYMEQQSEYNLTLQFEGVNIPDKEKVIAGVGAKRYPQHTVMQNNLPWYLKVVKI